jgi:hypothetical protein
MLAVAFRRPSPTPRETNHAAKGDADAYHCGDGEVDLDDAPHRGRCADASAAFLPPGVGMARFPRLGADARQAFEKDTGRWRAVVGVVTRFSVPFNLEAGSSMPKLVDATFFAADLRTYPSGAKTCAGSKPGGVTGSVAIIPARAGRHSSLVARSASIVRFARCPRHVSRYSSSGPSSLTPELANFGSTGISER